MYFDLVQMYFVVVVVVAMDSQEMHVPPCLFADRSFACDLHTVNWSAARAPVVVVVVV